MESRASFTQRKWINNSHVHENKTFKKDAVTRHHFPQMRGARVKWFKTLVLIQVNWRHLC